MTGQYYGVIYIVLKFILLVTSDKNKIETCISQKEYQLTHEPKNNKRWAGFLHDYMQSSEQCHLENICLLCLLTLLSLC